MYLITGSAGFIGFHLSLTLLMKGHHVIGLDSIIINTTEKLNMTDHKS